MRKNKKIGKGSPFFFPHRNKAKAPKLAVRSKPSGRCVTVIVTGIGINDGWQDKWLRKNARGNNVVSRPLIYVDLALLSMTLKGGKLGAS